MVTGSGSRRTAQHPHAMTQTLLTPRTTRAPPAPPRRLRPPRPRQTLRPRRPSLCGRLPGRGRPLPRPALRTKSASRCRRGSCPTRTPTGARRGSCWARGWPPAWCCCWPSSRPRGAWTCQGSPDCWASGAPCTVYGSRIEVGARLAAPPVRGTVRRAAARGGGPGARPRAPAGCRARCGAARRRSREARLEPHAPGRGVDARPHAVAVAPFPTAALPANPRGPPGAALAAGLPLSMRQARACRALARAACVIDCLVAVIGAMAVSVTDCSGGGDSESAAEVCKGGGAPSSYPAFRGEGLCLRSGEFSVPACWRLPAALSCHLQGGHALQVGGGQRRAYCESRGRGSVNVYVRSLSPLQASRGSFC